MINFQPFFFTLRRVDGRRRRRARIKRPGIFDINQGYAHNSLPLRGDSPLREARVPTGLEGRSEAPSIQRKKNKQISFIPKGTIIA
jgi:hypothetical protein